MFLSREDKETHPDLTGIRAPEKAEKNNFCGFIRMGNKTWFCCTHYDPDGDMYYHCAVPAAALYLTTVFVSIGVLIAVLFFFPLMRMYTRLLLVDVVKSSKEKAPGYEFRKFAAGQEPVPAEAAALEGLDVYALVDTTAETPQALLDELGDLNELISRLKQAVSILGAKEVLEKIATIKTVVRIFQSAIQKLEEKERKKIQDIVDRVQLRKVSTADEKEKSCKAVRSGIHIIRGGNDRSQSEHDLCGSDQILSRRVCGEPEKSDDSSDKPDSGGRR